MGDAGTTGDDLKGGVELAAAGSPRLRTPARGPPARPPAGSPAPRWPEEEPRSPGAWVAEGDMWTPEAETRFRRVFPRSRLAAAAAPAADRARHWTPELENIARHAMRRADGYAFMYEQMAASMKGRGEALGVASGVLGVVLGTAGFASLFVAADTPLWARALNLVAGYVVGVIAVLEGVFGFERTRCEATIYQVSYAAVARDIMCQLAQPRRDRPDAREYIRTKLGEIERLKLSAPLPSAAARRAYLRRFRAGGGAGADGAGGLGGWPSVRELGRGSRSGSRSGDSSGDSERGPEEPAAPGAAADG